jgi:hypothetical protein
MANISPGVYTKIIDLSTYVQAVPSTIGCLCGLTSKGEDNVLKFIGSRAEFISEFGEPNISEFGKNYGQGPYIAYNFLGESGALYFMRVLPDNASFANILISANMLPTDANATVSISNIPAANSLNELYTVLGNTASGKPLCILRPIGRGQYYNGLSVRFTEYANPMVSGIYIFDIYERQSDGDEVIVESFQVSFDPSATDSSGESIWIVNVLQMYSNILRAVMNVSDGSFSPGHNLVSKVYTKNLGEVTITKDLLLASLTDIKQDFDMYATDSLSLPHKYCITISDQRGNKLQGWIGGVDVAGNSIEIFNSRLNTTNQSWIGNIANFDETGEISYEIKESFAKVSSAFLSATPQPLRRGSDGSLRAANGDLDTTTATQLLAQAYTGQITSKVDASTAVDDILDNENIYFSVVYDAGYPSEVKTKIVELCQTRRDCVCIVDNGDSSSFNTAMATRTTTHTFNNYFTALYEAYSKIYDSFTGQDVWFSPAYHMSYLLPRNDNVAEIWWAVAGFNRAPIENIRELRYSPKLGQRDQMFLRQLNPIVKFANGYTVWGQLTSQSKPSALQDLNIVRLVLYIKRALEQYSRFFIYEMNDAITWSSVAGNINEFLESIKKNRGLYGYSVDVGATAYEIKRKTFHINVMLNPTRVVEQISLNFYVK